MRGGIFSISVDFCNFCGTMSIGKQIACKLLAPADAYLGSAPSGLISGTFYFIRHITASDLYQKNQRHRKSHSPEWMSGFFRFWDHIRPVRCKMAVKPDARAKKRRNMRYTGTECAMLMPAARGLTACRILLYNCYVILRRTCRYKERI